MHHSLWKHYLLFAWLDVQKTTKPFKIWIVPRRKKNTTSSNWRLQVNSSSPRMALPPPGLFYRWKPIYTRTLEMIKHFSKHHNLKQPLSRVCSISQKAIKSGCWPLSELLISKDSVRGYLVVIPCCFLSVDFSVVFTFLSWSGIVKHQCPRINISCLSKWTGGEDFSWFVSSKIFSGKSHFTILI